MSIIRIYGWRQNDLVQAQSNGVLWAARAYGAALHTAEPSCCIVIVQHVERKGWWGLRSSVCGGRHGSAGRYRQRRARERRFNNRLHDRLHDSWEEALLALRPDVHHCSAPAPSSEHMNVARALVLRVGDATAASQFARMFTQGYPTAMQPLVAGVAGERLKAQELPAPTRKRDRVTVPGSKERLAVWQGFGADVPELRDVAVRLLSAHATSAARECNWSLWGRIIALRALL